MSTPFNQMSTSFEQKVAYFEQMSAPFVQMVASFVQIVVFTDFNMVSVVLGVAKRGVLMQKRINEVAFPCVFSGYEL
jgi:hypothetical protein